MSYVVLFCFFLPRAFKINELKAEVAHHLAVLEKRVECEWHVDSLSLICLLTSV